MRVSLDRAVFEGDLDVFADKPELQGYQLSNAAPDSEARSKSLSRE